MTHTYTHTYTRTHTLTHTHANTDPGKIPTGTMSTFTASKKHVGKDKSQTCHMSCKVDGHTWHGQYVTKMKEHYGSRFEVKTSPAKKH